MTRVLILAAGEGRRWNDFRGSPKHLVAVEGEVLLERTCRQFLKYTDDVVVVGADERFLVQETRLFVPEKPNPYWRDLSKFLSSVTEWGAGRTVLAFGDVYFTDDAVHTIMGDNRAWTVFLRRGPSSFTGCKWKEIFAISISPAGRSEVLETLQKLTVWNAPSHSGGWKLFAALTAGLADDPFDTDCYVNIDDWTDDFDYPDDLVAWEAARQAARERAPGVEPGLSAWKAEVLP